MSFVCNFTNNLPIELKTQKKHNYIYLDLNACHAASISAYKFFSDGLPVLIPYPE